MPYPAPGKLPKNAGLKELGFTAAQLAKLTPAARKLTKGELIALQKWGASGGKGPAPGHLTVQDLSSLQKAYGSAAGRASMAMKKKSSNGTTYCCCCSPCCTCTAAAEIAPIRTL